MADAKIFFVYSVGVGLFHQWTECCSILSTIPLNPNWGWRLVSATTNNCAYCDGLWQHRQENITLRKILQL